MGSTWASGAVRRRPSAWETVGRGGVAGPRARPGTVGAVIVAVLLVAGVVGTGVALAAPSPPDGPGCRPVTLYAVAGRGSDSTATLTGLTGLTAAVAARSGERVSVVTVPPPPAGTSYAASAADAVVALGRTVGEHAQTCPDGSLMLFGYAEGAQVVGDLASRIGTGQGPVDARRVLAVGLFEDPARDPVSRSVPEGATGQGVLPPRGAGFGSLDPRTIEICAPHDPVCDNPAERPAPAVDAALASPGRAVYAELGVVPGVRVVDWASDSLGAVVARTPDGPVADGASATGRAPTSTTTAGTLPTEALPTTQAPPTTEALPTTEAPPTSEALPTTEAAPSSTTTPTTTAAPPSSARPSTPRSTTPRSTPSAGAPGRDTGATWAMTSGLDGFKSTPWNNEGATDPTAAASPTAPGRTAVKFEMPGGGKRTEAEPDVPNFSDGETAFVGYSGTFAEGFPVDTGDWQLIVQFKQPGTGSPPLAVEVGNSQLRLANNGTGQKDFCPVRAGAPFSFRLKITFGGAIDAWCGGRQTLSGYRTPSPNVAGSAYLKTGIYRNPGISGDSTLFLDDLKIGKSLASVSGLAGADDPAAGPTTSTAPTGSAPTGSAPTSRTAPASTTRRAATGGGQKICEKFGSADVDDGRYLVQNNEWGADDGQCITTTGAGFTVASGDHVKGDGPAAYPSIMSGCWMGTCTAGTMLPAKVGELGPITSSISATLPGGTRTNLAYDIWADSTPRRTGQNDALELMIWLREDGGVDPIGARSGTATIGGATWDVWKGDNGGVAVISYVRRGYVATARDLPISAFVADAVKQGVVSPAAYLTNIQAGFEPWTGGPGLAVDDFSVAYGRT